jgi:hypothetical protein
MGLGEAAICHGQVADFRMDDGCLVKFLLFAYAVVFRFSATNFL